jgi:hypothetical protein
LLSAIYKYTSYNIRAVFEGDEPCNATAYGYTPNGTEYAVCTTVQYGFKPSSNNTWLTVEPQSTQVMQQTKTPEQTQAEAESSGWFRVKLGIGKGFIFRVFPRVLFSACLELTILLPHFCSDTYSP